MWLCTTRVTSRCRFLSTISDLDQERSIYDWWSVGLLYCGRVIGREKRKEETTTGDSGIYSLVSTPFH